MQNVFMCIDLKTFYASVECVERGLDPFSVDLVVADPSRGKGAICLAISPHLKLLGVKNRCRLYEIPSSIKYIIAVPRMAKYIEYSANIYKLYLKYFSADDMHVYSIDEVFIDVTHYLNMYKTRALGLAKTVIQDILDTFGITATCGIGSNMYLAKIALDIMSKHSITNIGWLDEEKYMKELWHHRPLTDFWQVGPGTARRLKKFRALDMYDIAHLDPKLLYKEFGVNAEFLIDHAWGREPCTIAAIKAYKPKSQSLSGSQILFSDYTYEKARIVLKEMVEMKSLELIKHNLSTDSISLYIGYSKDVIPHTGGMARLHTRTNTYSELVEAFLHLYDKTTDNYTLIRRIGISLNHLEPAGFKQLSLFEDNKLNQKEKKIEKAIISVKAKMGPNSILKGMNLQEGATQKIRNGLIGGHNANAEVI